MQTAADENESRDLSAPAFRRIVLALTALFLAVETFCILRFPLVMDEFVDADLVHRLASKLPFRELALSKTVLGYYVQLPVLVSVADAWNALLAVKLEMALIAAATIAGAAFVLARDYSRSAVVAALTLLVTMSTFYERAADFRSDMLTGATGLIALLCLLRSRPGWAGFWCAISLMMSQKGAYYVLASEAALVVCVAVYRRRENLRDFLLFNVTSFVTFAAYLLFWMALSSPQAVIYNTFIAQQTNAFGNHFTDIRAAFWSQTVRRNPVFYALSAAAIAFICWRAAQRRVTRDVLLAVYTVALTALCIWHKQPWPYFFVMLVPFLFVVQLPLLTELLQSRGAQVRRATLAVVLAGAALALLIRVPASLSRDSGYQRATFRLGTHLLRDGGTYFAGVPIFYRHEQAGGSELNSVDTVQSKVLNQLPTDEVMTLVRRLDSQPVRFIVFTYRIDGLPKLIRQYLVATFEPYRGIVFIYAPRIRSGQFTLHFDGDYIVESRASVSLDGRAFAPGTRLRLAKGRHTAQSTGVFRLKLDPAPPPAASAADEMQDFFPGVYTF